MANFKAAESDGEGYESSRGQNVFLIDPRGLTVDWSLNVSRAGQPIEVDDDIIALARDMRPRDQGGQGQLAPIITRPVGKDGREVVAGFRRYAAALWNVESGECPDFKVAFKVNRLTNREAALLNFAENYFRLDPKPIQQAHSIRSLIEDHGFTAKEIAGQMGKSESWISQRISLVMLSEPIQEEIKAGEMPVAAGLELAKLPEKDQVAAVSAIKAKGEKVSGQAVKEVKREIHEKTGQGGPVPRTLTQLKSFLNDRITPIDGNDAQKELATTILGWIAGEMTDAQLIDLWCDIDYLKPRKVNKK